MLPAYARTDYMLDRTAQGARKKFQAMTLEWARNDACTVDTSESARTRPPPWQANFCTAQKAAASDRAPSAAGLGPGADGARSDAAAFCAVQKFACQGGGRVRALSLVSTVQASLRAHSRVIAWNFLRAPCAVRSSM